MGTSNVVIQVAAIKTSEMEIGKDYEFSTDISLSEGTNKISLTYPHSRDVDYPISLRIRLFSAESKTDILRTFPRTPYGEPCNFYVESEKPQNTKLKYYIRKTEDFAAESASFILCPDVKTSRLTHLHEAVDKVYVINLASREDKREKMKARLEFHDIRHEFFDAVDGRSEDQYTRWFRSVTSRKMNPLESKLGRPEMFYCGAWGYNETYINLIKHAISSKFKAIAIFDDDVLFHNDFPLMFDQFAKTEEFSNHSLIYLGCRFLDKDKDLPQYVEYDARIVGSYAVIIKSDAFASILKYLEKREHVVDGDSLKHLFASRKALALRDPLVLPEYANGDIRADRDSKSIYASQGWELSHFGHDVYSRESYVFREINAGVFTSVSTHAVIGIKCKNRLEYLKDLVDSFLRTKSSDIGYRMYVADTSTDPAISSEIVNYLETLDLENVTIAYLRFCDGSVTDLSNGILSEVLNCDIRYNPYVFMCDEDIKFLKQGWDKSYIHAMERSEYKHLVFYDTRWRNPSQNKNLNVSDVRLHSKSTYLTTQGAFFSLTSEALKSVGLYNKDLFPTKGGGHLNYTYRLYRSLGLDPHFIYDVAHSETMIELQPHESYISTGSDLSMFHQVRVNSPEAHATFRTRIENEDSSFRKYKRVI